MGSIRKNNLTEALRLLRKARVELDQAFAEPENETETYYFHRLLADLDWLREELRNVDDTVREAEEFNNNNRKDNCLCV